ncbi:MAG: ferritin-like domain-containing protein [Bacilli bacterium]
MLKDEKVLETGKEETPQITEKRDDLGFLISDEIEAIDGYDKALKRADLSEEDRSKLERIRNDEIEHIDILNSIFKTTTTGAIESDNTLAKNNTEDSDVIPANNATVNDPLCSVCDIKENDGILENILNKGLDMLGGVNKMATATTDSKKVEDTIQYPQIKEFIAKAREKGLQYAGQENGKWKFLITPSVTIGSLEELAKEGQKIGPTFHQYPHNNYLYVDDKATASPSNVKDSTYEIESEEGDVKQMNVTSDKDAKDSVFEYFTNPKLIYKNGKIIWNVNDSAIRDYKSEDLNKVVSEKFNKLGKDKINDYVSQLKSKGGYKVLETRLIWDLLRITTNSGEISSWYDKYDVDDDHITSAGRKALKEMGISVRDSAIKDSDSVNDIGKVVLGSKLRWEEKYGNAQLTVVKIKKGDVTLSLDNGTTNLILPLEKLEKMLSDATITSTSTLNISEYDRVKTVKNYNVKVGDRKFIVKATSKQDAENKVRNIIK